MEFQTKVDIQSSSWKISPCEKMLFLGSCFADNIGNRFREEQFRAIVNPFGVMYNPASIFHSVQELLDSSHEIEGVESYEDRIPQVAIFTLGTNHVYILKETREIVDNCKKRPQHLFVERAMSVSECYQYLDEAVSLLRSANPEIKIILTVSPIRYRKYGYHGSQLSKATLQLAADQLVQHYVSEENDNSVCYFPAYEIVNDELRDYRFYKPDMLHPSEQTVEYIYERFAEAYFSEDTRKFLAEWKPIKEALGHKPFHPESEEYKKFMDKTMLKVSMLSKKYPKFAYQKIIK